MEKMSRLFCFLIGISWTLGLAGCSKEEVLSMRPDESVSVRFDIINDISGQTKAPGDTTISVNRILILPFRKADESLSNDPANFVPDYEHAKQVDVSSYPSISTKLNLLPESSYQIMAIGYNQVDYNFANQSWGSRRFDIGATGSATQANMYLKPVNPTVIPEFFSCIGVGYKDAAVVGNTFKTSQINSVHGELKRIVCGFTLTVSNIPAYVTTVTLAAEQLVTATRALDGTPLLWQTAGDTGVKSLVTLSPQSGKVTYNLYMLPTMDARKTLFYLDLKYGTVTDRYTVKIADNPGVVSGNRITFTPNHWVKVAGDYVNINFGFQWSENINLDDNAWDGLQ